MALIQRIICQVAGHRSSDQDQVRLMLAGMLEPVCDRCGGYLWGKTLGGWFFGGWRWLGYQTVWRRGR